MLERNKGLKDSKRVDMRACSDPRVATEASCALFPHIQVMSPTRAALDESLQPTCKVLRRNLGKQGRARLKAKKLRETTAGATAIQPQTKTSEIPNLIDFTSHELAAKYDHSLQCIKKTGK